MRRVFCDRCGGEIPPKEPAPGYFDPNVNTAGLQTGEFTRGYTGDLCLPCLDDFGKFLANERVLARER